MWISLNPHIPTPPFDQKWKDNNPNQTYRKTFLWITPRRVLRGVITQGEEGTAPDFSGEFSTPNNPNGKDASRLTDEEKQALINLFEEEKPSAKRLEKKHLPGLDEAKRRLQGGRKVPKKRGRRIAKLWTAGNVDGSLLGLNVSISGPSATRVGEYVVFKAAASTALTSRSELVHYLWSTDESDIVQTGTTFTAKFERVGLHVVHCQVVDEFDAIGEASYKVRVDSGSPEK